MAYELTYDADTNCAVLRIKDTVITMDLIREIAPQVGRMCQENGCNRLLNDMTAATIEISIVELFTSPRTMDESGVSRTIKRALVIPSSFNEARFLENVSCNRGHNLKLFTDIDEAKEWLLND